MDALRKVATPRRCRCSKALARRRMPGMAYQAAWPRRNTNACNAPTMVVSARTATAAGPVAQAPTSTMSATYTLTSACTGCPLLLERHRLWDHRFWEVILSCIRVDLPGQRDLRILHHCRLWQILMRLHASATAKKGRNWVESGGVKEESGGFCRGSICDQLQKRGQRLSFVWAWGDGILRGSCPDSRKAPLVWLRFAKK